ncbi:hypothetical protein [Noviherbaspirillum massiliense]|uniref:hypothetical protein n=1 Tax=Noviherbaspirillum massiliense TaxID=1465823 RepID=UPI0003146D98|nr:hypothetical protein [Noviherbaspirillum massiliense]
MDAHQHISLLSPADTERMLMLLKNACHGGGAMKPMPPSVVLHTGTTTPSSPAFDATV